MPIFCYLKKPYLFFLLALSVQSIATNRMLNAWILSDPIQFHVPAGVQAMSITYTTTFVKHTEATLTVTVNMTVTNSAALDGIDSSQFLRSDVTDTFTGGSLIIAAPIQVIAGGDLTVTGSSNFYGSLSSTGLLHNQGDFTITGSTIMYGPLTMRTPGTQIYLDDFHVNDDINAHGDLTIGATTTLRGALGVYTTAGVKRFGINTIDGVGTMIGDFTVTDSVTVGGAFGVTGAATLGSTLGVTGDLAVNTNKFNVTAASGNTTIAGTLAVTGATSLAGTLNVVGDANFVGGSDLTVTGSANIYGSLSSTGLFFNQGDFTITGSTIMHGPLTMRTPGTQIYLDDFHVNDDINAHGDLTVGATTTLRGALGVYTTAGVKRFGINTIDGVGTMIGDFTVTDSATIGGTLNVSGVANFGDDVHITEGGDLTVTGSSQFYGPILLAKPDGIAPFTVLSTTTVDRLSVRNADMLDGHHAADFVFTSAQTVNMTVSNSAALDGIDSSQFLRSDVTDTFTGGSLFIAAPIQVIAGGDLTVTGSSQFYGPILLAKPDGIAPFTVLSTTTVDRLSVRNADMLDGHHASDFVLTGAPFGDADTLDGYHATDFMISNFGNFNTALGLDALDQITTGTYNVAIGYRAGHLLTSNESFDICIGNNGVPGSSNAIRIGDPNSHHSCYVAGIYGKTASQDVFVMIGADGRLGTITSSQKFKTDIKDMGNASAEVRKLRPVTFKYKPEYEPSGRIQYGLIAEEVEAVNPELIVYDTDGKPYTVRYAALIPMLVNEYQQQQKKLDLIEQKTALCGKKKNVLFGTTPQQALSITFADTVNPAIVMLSFVSKTYAYTTKFIFDGKESVMFASNTTADNIPVIITASINNTTVTFKHQHPSNLDATLGNVFYEINGEEIAIIS